MPRGFLISKQTKYLIFRYGLLNQHKRYTAKWVHNEIFNGDTSIISVQMIECVLRFFARAKSESIMDFLTSDHPNRYNRGRKRKLSDVEVDHAIEILKEVPNLRLHSLL